MSYFQLDFFSDISEAEVIGIWNEDLFYTGKIPRDYLVTPCEYSFENNKHSQLENPIITDIPGPRGYNFDGSMPIIVSDKCQKGLMPYITTEFKLINMGQGVNALTKEKIPFNFHLILVPYMDISNFINFEESEFVFYEGATNSGNAKAKRKMQGFKQHDFIKWVNNYWVSLKINEWTGGYL